MTLDQTIGSVRADKEKVTAARRIVRGALTAFLASLLTLPSLAASGMETSPRRVAARPGDMLPLPPIPYLQSIPWMKWNIAAPTLRVDTLMTPLPVPSDVGPDLRDRAPARPAIS